MGIIKYPKISKNGNPLFFPVSGPQFDSAPIRFTNLVISLHSCFTDRQLDRARLF